jgi:adenine-specific DNA-methyltransferase
LKEYQFEVVNDELIITDENGELFEYHYTNKESQRVQEAIFHEKQTIIGNCLFGVDINPNSVKICRLRLWIELLKNAYYKNETELETLPNIDINIKCGNSLISRFWLDADIKEALKQSKWMIDSYRLAVDAYRNAQNKDEKHAMERLINDIKSDFRSEISKSDPKLRKLYKLQGEFTKLTTQQNLFGMAAKEKKDWNKKLDKLSIESKKLDTEIEEIKNNKIYENAFEWRFEFPEVLNDKGDFVGFDVVIGNPPYIRQEELKEFKGYFKSTFETYSGTADIYIFFIEKGFSIMKKGGVFTFIMPNKFMQTGCGKPARQFLMRQNLLEILDFGDLQVFEEATTYPCILTASKAEPTQYFNSIQIETLAAKDNFGDYVKSVNNVIERNSLTSETWVISNSEVQILLKKINDKSVRLENYIKDGAKRGVVTGLTEAFVIDNDKRDELIQLDSKNESIIKLLVQGRDLKPYNSILPQKSLLFIAWHFSLQNNSEITGASDIATKEFETQFPSLFNHLSQYKVKLSARNKVETGVRYEWYAMQRYASDYFEDFDKPKIMFQKFQIKPCFIYDETGLFCNDSIWFIPSSNMVLLGILNSKIGWWLISKYCTQIQNGYQLIWKYFSQIPIAKANTEQVVIITEKVNQILTLKKENPSVDTSALEAEIDQMVYELYDLTPDEIAIVEAEN